MKGEMKGQGLNEKKMKEESSMKLSIGEIQKKKLFLAETMKNKK